MRVSAPVIFGGIIAALAIAWLMPAISLLSWSSDLCPIFLMSAGIFYWLVIVRPRKGFNVDIYDESVSLAFIFAASAMIMTLYGLPLQERVGNTLAAIVAFLSFRAMDASLFSAYI